MKKEMMKYPECEHCKDKDFECEDSYCDFIKELYEVEELHRKFNEVGDWTLSDQETTERTWRPN